MQLLGDACGIGTRRLAASSATMRPVRCSALSVRCTWAWPRSGPVVTEEPLEQPPVLRPQDDARLDLRRG